MFEALISLPADPILGLMSLYQQDENPYKVDLGVGVYKNELGETPVLSSIKKAEHRVIGRQISKTYVGPSGNAQFNQLLSQLLFGQHSSVIRDARLAVAQTPGGCGALRVAAELIHSVRPEAQIWVSDPTWGNHIPLLGGCGISIRIYPYFDAETSTLDFDAMMTTLAEVKKGDLVLLHGCCHNPTGVDLNPQQWQQLANLAVEKGFTPFIDMAYQGFGDGVEQDAYGLRLLAESVPELVFAASCSKNFGLYRERVGLVGVIGSTPNVATAALSHMLSIIRGIYSMPPDHGAALVAEVLADEQLFAIWVAEVDEMRSRISGLRNQFSQIMLNCTKCDRFDFVKNQKGMFSFLGLTTNQVALLRKEYSIYMLDSSRISIAGLNHSSLEYVCRTIAKIIA
jgi:aspartate aminotransferase